MYKQQPVYLLAGGRGRSIMTTISNIQKIIKDIGQQKPVIAYVGTASLKDNWLIFAILSAFIKMGCKCRISRVVIAPRNANLEKAKQILSKADAVLVSGGYVDVGMQVLQEKKMVGFIHDLAKAGKLFIGISAGSIMISKEWVRWRNPQDDDSAELFHCLGLVPIICDTHAEKDDWIELKTALQLEKTGITGYGITSGAYLKAYPDGRLEAKAGNVARFARRNAKIERMDDLLTTPDKPNNRE
jgi:peptidase E